MEQKNKVWFITGASKGFGLAFIKSLLASGYQVAATSRNAQDIRKHFDIEHDNLLALTVDLTNEDSVKDAIQKAVARFGRLDVVVNNAGYAILGAVEMLSDKEFRQTIDVNLFGTVNVIRTVMPHLRKQQSGHIINFSSVAGYRGFGNAASYHAAKFAVVGLSEALAEEVKPFGIKVTVVAPGYFRTAEGSSMVAKNRISAYNMEAMEAAMREMNGKQPGDPYKLVSAILKIVEEPNPPVHLLMGPDAYMVVTEKRKMVDQEFERWKAVTMSTNF